jgi:hypothetical protein
VSGLHSAYWQARALGASFQLLPGRRLRILGLERLPTELQHELSRLLENEDTKEELAWLTCLDAGRAIPREEVVGIPRLRPYKPGGYIRALVREGVHASPEQVLQRLVSIALEFSCPSLERASACWLDFQPRIRLRDHQLPLPGTAALVSDEALALYQRLRAMNAVIEVRGETLVVWAPKILLTPEMAVQIRRRKREIAFLLDEGKKRSYLVHVLDCRGLRLALGRTLARAAMEYRATKTTKRP